MLIKFSVSAKILLFLLLSLVYASEHSFQNVLSIIDILKTQNFFVQKLGVLVTGSLTSSEIETLQKIQTAQPRQMRIYVTQNDLLGDVYRDFTFLAKSKQVDAILVWPAECWDEDAQRVKICQMSMRTKVPVIGMQAGWVERGAMLQFDHLDGRNRLRVNQKVCDIFNYVPAEVAGISMLSHD